MALRAEAALVGRVRARALGAFLVGLLGASGCSLSASPSKPRATPIDDDFARGSVVWPAEGRVSSNFGPRGNTKHDGIDIAAAEGTPVYAAAGGTVIFSGLLRGYGNTVILEHRGGITTIYAHNRENIVQAGARVRKGELIATVGRSGKTTGPNLHFEVRRSKVAEDPLAFLPNRSPPVVAKQEKRPKKRVGVGG
jgi:lipoprotein NlpD